jgi:undecaprenyl-diphosphatase
MHEKKTIQTVPPQKISQPVKGSLAFILEIIAGTAVIVSSLLFFSYLGDHVLDKQLFWFDSSIFKLLYPYRNPFLTQSMLFFTFLGSGTFLTPVVILVIVYLLWKKRQKDALIFSFLLFFGTQLNFLLKSIFRRDRPEFHPLVNEPSYSFPSGHTMNSFIFYASLAFFIFLRMKNKLLGWVFTGLAFLIILLIGFSRIYLGAHYPSDVLAGLIAGFLWFIAGLLFEKTLRFLRLFT